MGEEDYALTKAIESRDADLINFMLLLSPEALEISGFSCLIHSAVVQTDYLSSIFSGFCFPDKINIHRKALWFDSLCCVF